MVGYFYASMNVITTYTKKNTKKPGTGKVSDILYIQDNKPSLTGKAF